MNNIKQIIPAAPGWRLAIFDSTENDGVCWYDIAAWALNDEQRVLPLVDVIGELAVAQILFEEKEILGCVGPADDTDFIYNEAQEQLTEETAEVLSKAFAGVEEATASDECVKGTCALEANKAVTTDFEAFKAMLKGAGIEFKTWGLRWIGVPDRPGEVQPFVGDVIVVDSDNDLFTEYVFHADGSLKEASAASEG